MRVLENTLLSLVIVTFIMLRSDYDEFIPGKDHRNPELLNSRCEMESHCSAKYLYEDNRCMGIHKCVCDYVGWTWTCGWVWVCMHVNVRLCDCCGCMCVTISHTSTIFIELLVKVSSPLPGKYDRPHVLILPVYLNAGSLCMEREDDGKYRFVFSAPSL